MKNMKKLLALVLAAIMMMALCGTAFAEPTDASDAYKVAKVEVSGIKTGNTLTLYKIIKFKYDSATNAIDYELASGLPTEYDSIDELAALSPSSYTLAGVTDTIRIAADKLAYGIQNGDITPIATVSGTASGDKVTFENLPAGWYVAVATGTADTSIIYQNMIINAMPVVDSEHNSYKSAENIGFEVKHTTDTISKGVGSTPDHDEAVDTTDEYSIGDKVPYEIRTKIPNYPATSKVATFKITDTPSDLTDIIDATGDDKMTVSVGGTAVDRGESTYTVTQEGDGFVIVFAKDYILAHAGQDVVVNYKATIKDSATVEANGLTASNTAKITFNPNSNEVGTVEPDDTTEVYTYGVNVFKYDSADNQKLTGAKFILYKEDGTTIAGAETEVDENGYVSWNGLAAGTYKLVETQAPAGYRLDSTPKEVVLSKTAATEDDRKTTTTETNFKQVDVPNDKGATLPSTGGIGTTIFYVAGIVMVLGAAVVLISRRKAEAED